ncbi:putative BTB/POZ domain-containing protein 2 [Hypsibius exemplaris]|uniref:BTB/POZ domain-containing protein 2 n=1 Tax=Hypsibius exemplaris TaxID=2072580 RepID=A0A1W0WZH9_HYPEX|nr:putative BTB/POZ domain-containing protein 2 [Hypsibius exemplaris]
MAGTKTWQDSKHIRKRTKYLLENTTSIPTDIIFKVGTPASTATVENISAHRLVLAMGSIVFHAMFYGNLREQVGIIPVPDVEPEAFWIMIRYLYSEDVTGLTMENVMETIYCAKKYLIKQLVHRCRLFLQAELKIDDAWSILFKAREIAKEDQIAEVALRFICSRASEALSCTQFLSVPFNLLREILKRNDFAIASENRVYEAVHRWGMANYSNEDGDQLRNISELVRDCVRLRLMKPVDIANGPEKDQVLVGDELAQLYQFLFRKPDAPFLPSPIPFRTEDRLVASSQRSFLVINLRHVLAVTGLIPDSDNDDDDDDDDDDDERNWDTVHGGDGAVTLELKLDYAPLSCRFVMDKLRDSATMVSVAFGDTAFESYKGQPLVEALPIESGLLLNCPWMVSLGVCAVDEAAPSKTFQLELRIAHPFKNSTVGNDSGVVFAKVVDGENVLLRLEKASDTFYCSRDPEEPYFDGIDVFDMAANVLGVFETHEAYLAYKAAGQPPMAGDG